MWRSTRPYFSPDDPGLDPPALVPAPPAGVDIVTYDDAGAIGNVALNYAYVIRGVTAAGAKGESNRVGEFDFAIVPGQ